MFLGRFSFTHQLNVEKYCATMSHITCGLLFRDNKLWTNLGYLTFSGFDLDKNLSILGSIYKYLILWIISDCL